MPEEKSTLDKEYFEKRFQESEWTKEEKETGLTGRTFQVRIIVLNNVNIGFKKPWFPTRGTSQEGF